MITITAQIISRPNQPIDIQVDIVAVAGSPGILAAEVTAYNQAGGFNPAGAKTDLAYETAKDCPDNLSFVVKAIARTSLPIYIQAWECMGGVDQGQGPVATTVGPLFGEPLKCNPGGNQPNQVCTDLQKQIQDKRNLLITDCALFAGFKSQRDTFAAALAGATAAWVALIVAAAAAPWPYNLVLWVLAAAASVFVTFFSGEVWVAQSNMDRISGMMNQLRMDITTLVNRLSDLCCTDLIWVMRDLPVCPA